MEIRQGTTPTLFFNLPIPISTLHDAYVTFEQRGVKTLEKAIADCECEGHTLAVHLTQEETLSFCLGCPLEVQLNGVDNAGERVATDVFKLKVLRTLKKEVI